MPLSLLRKAELVRKENDASKWIISRPWHGPDKRDLVHFSLRLSFVLRTFRFASYLQYTYRGRRILPSASQLSLLGSFQLSLLG
jgi:hypothetical protein